MQIYLAQYYNDGPQYLLVAKTLNDATNQAAQLPNWRGGNVYEITNIHGKVFNSITVKLVYR